MPALAPPAPNVFKKMLELEGYQLDHDGNDNWGMVCNKHYVVIPKHGETVDLEVVDSVLNPAGITNARYFELLNEAKSILGL